MSGMEFYVKDEEERKRLIDSYIEEDERYLKALDDLKEDLVKKGIDPDSPEGKKAFIVAVRKLNETYS